MNKWQRWLTMLLLFFPLFAWADAGKITGLTIKNDNRDLLITIKFDQAIPHHVFTLDHPDRLVMDFENAHLQVDRKKLVADDNGVEKIRSGHPVPRTLRLVFDLSGAAHVKVLSQPNDSQLILDLNVALPKIKKITPLTKKTVMKNVVTPPPEKHTIIVVIDPGHGGKDPGAMGRLGAQEKNIVLEISKRLAILIDKQPNMHAVLTRNKDHFVSLRDRLRRARKGNADIFISIHADSFFDDHSTGASVYALSQRGATSTAASWLAKRENHSELGNVNLNGLDDQSYVLRSVLIDLAQTATITSSLHLGTVILGQLDNVSRLHYKEVEQAPFMVLKSPDIPSVLVETGFLSNPKEELKLRDKIYQEKIAQSIFNGVRVYLKKYNSTDVT